MDILKELGKMIISIAIALIGYLIVRLAPDFAFASSSSKGVVLAILVGAGGYLIYRIGILIWKK